MNLHDNLPAKGLNKVTAANSSAKEPLVNI